MEPLQALRQIFQEAESLQSADELLHLIVDRVKGVTHSDVCSIYLKDELTEEWVLVATEGLSESAVGKVRMKTSDGLVGYIAENQKLLNLKNGSKHSFYKYFPETGEEHFAGFLGVPIISFRQFVGVLVIQCRDERQFSVEEEAFLITIAAQMASPLTSVLKQDKLKALVSSDATEQIKVTGVKGATGICTGMPVFLPTFVDILKISDIKSDGEKIELKRLSRAIESVKLEIQASESKLADSVDNDVKALFGVYLMLLENDAIVTETEALIKQGLSAVSALKAIVAKHVHAFESMEDPYMKARAEDIKHLGARIYSRLSLKKDQQKTPEIPFILIGMHLSIADVAEYSSPNLKGIVCMKGSSLSHTAVLASAMGIPAIMGLGEVDMERVVNKTAVMDGYRAQIIFNAPETMLEEYRRLISQENKLLEGLDRLKDKRAETTDGYQVNLYANTGLIADISPGLEKGAEGVGLYRSEIPFMLHDTFPTEDEQVEVYKKTLEAYSPSSVYMRTLDIGGDKELPYYSFKEDNPYLGWRGIRFTLDNTSIFLAQIRALLRANIETQNLKIMLPMVSRVEEVDAFKHLLDKAIKQLWEEGLEVARPKVGIMVEVPSSMLVLDHLAKRIDFVSIGSNDLTQYLLAVDRNNAKVSPLYNFLNPAVIHAIQQIVAIAHRNKLKVSVCGEMASDPVAVLLLVGMGVETLSMSAFNIPKIKWVIRSFSYLEAKKLATKALNLESEECIRQMLELELESHGLSALIRAGA